MYNWAVLLYTRDWYKIVNQLYFNKKKFKNQKKSTTQSKNWQKTY